MTGNQAVARGFWEAGGVVASSYPGSPTVEILDSLKEYKEIQSKWATNEKVALEIAMGGSFAGARSMVSMKHVGVNIAADPFMTFTQIKTNGGFLLVVGDDPGLSSSQNEQDTRFYGKFANCVVLEPATQQEVKDYVIMGLDISERFNTPVILRLTSRLCHSRGIVQLGKRNKVKVEGFKEDQSRYCMLPPYANEQQYFMKDRLQSLVESKDMEDLILFEGDKKDVLIITSGFCHKVVKELNLNADILKLGIVYPLPIKQIKDVVQNYKRVIVVEELLGFVQDNLKLLDIPTEGKEYFSFTGEYNIENLKEAFQKAGLIEKIASEGEMSQEITNELFENVPNRTPMLCAGCPHRPIFDILKKAKALVVGDIGCYSLGILEPFEVLKTNISMGASLGIIQGMAMGHKEGGISKPLVATIGDGTFFHSGLAGFVDIANTKENITFIVLDNRTTAMTGGQITPTTNEYTKQGDYTLNIGKILKTFGIEDVQEIDQFDYNIAKKAIRDAMTRDGLSVVIATRPCALNFKVKEPHFFVDDSICISCRSCIKVNCPPISMRYYGDKEKKNSYIDPTMCVGCSVCSQVCPVGAIKRSNGDKGGN